jgi:hypothetical protein
MSLRKERVEILWCFVSAVVKVTQKNPKKGRYGRRSGKTEQGNRCGCHMVTKTPSVLLSHLSPLNLDVAPLAALSSLVRGPATLTHTYPYHRESVGFHRAPNVGGI